jgi:hypothetical protein
MPTMMFVVIYIFLPEIIQPLTWTSLPVLFAVTFVFPMINMAVLKKTGWISSFRLEDRKERPVPFVFVATFFGMASYLFFEVNSLVAIIFISTTAMILMLTLITLWYQISIHAAGLCGIVGFLMSLSIQFPDTNIIYCLAAMMLIAGLVMSARLQLNAHTPKEIFLGAILGFGICFSALHWLI